MSKANPRPGIVQHRMQSLNDPDVIERAFRVATHWMRVTPTGGRETFEQAMIDEFGGERVYFPVVTVAIRLEEEARERVRRAKQAERVATMRLRGCSFSEIARVERISRVTAYRIATDAPVSACP